MGGPCRVRGTLYPLRQQKLDKYKYVTEFEEKRERRMREEMREEGKEGGVTDMHGSIQIWNKVGNRLTLRIFHSHVERLAHEGLDVSCVWAERHLKKERKRKD